MNTNDLHVLDKSEELRNIQYEFTIPSWFTPQNTLRAPEFIKLTLGSPWLLYLDSKSPRQQLLWEEKNKQTTKQC